MSGSWPIGRFQRVCARGGAAALALGRGVAGALAGTEAGAVGTAELRGAMVEVGSASVRLEVVVAPPQATSARSMKPGSNERHRAIGLSSHVAHCIRPHSR